MKIKLIEPLLMKNLSVQNSSKKKTIDSFVYHIYPVLDSGLLLNELFVGHYHNNVINGQITKQSKTSRVFEYSFTNIYLLALLNPVQNVEFVFVVCDFIFVVQIHHILL